MSFSRRSRSIERRDSRLTVSVGGSGELTIELSVPDEYSSAAEWSPVPSAFGSWIQFSGMKFQISRQNTYEIFDNTVRYNHASLFAVSLYPVLLFALFFSLLQTISSLILQWHLCNFKIVVNIDDCLVQWTSVNVIIAIYRNSHLILIIYCYYSVNVIIFDPAKNDHIKLNPTVPVLKFCVRIFLEDLKSANGILFPWADQYFDAHVSTIIQWRVNKYLATCCNHLL